MLGQLQHHRFSSEMTLHLLTEVIEASLVSQEDYSSKADDIAQGFQALQDLCEDNEFVPRGATSHLTVESLLLLGKIIAEEADLLSSLNKDLLRRAIQGKAGAPQLFEAACYALFHRRLPADVVTALTATHQSRLQGGKIALGAYTFEQALSRRPAELIFPIGHALTPFLKFDRPTSASWEVARGEASMDTEV